MAITEAVTQAVTAHESTDSSACTPTTGATTTRATAPGTGAATKRRSGAGTKEGAAGDGSCAGRYQPIPVWFFAFEGLLGASYDIARTGPHGWMVIAVAAAVNLVLARTVLRGRLKMAKAMLRGKRTRKIALALIALRLGVHVVLGLVGVEATAPAAHIAFALFMCATTVTLLAVEQRIMLRALNAESCAPAARPHLC